MARKMNDNIKANYDMATIVGLFGALFLILIALSMGGNLGAFINLPSILIVIGGTGFATLACFSVSEIRDSLKISLNTMFNPSLDTKNAVFAILQAAESTRGGGILGIQGKALERTKRFKLLYDGLSMLIDGIGINEALEAMRQAISSDVIRKKKTSSILRKSAEIAPAFGLIGTLIGLIQMLGNMKDPSSIGPAMAVALITTFYGAILANVVLNPLASKLERNYEEEFLINQLCLLGVSSISKLENPRKTEIILNSVLPENLKVRYFD
ncbi:MAG: Chemotaxis protein PomA [Alphaproteobacteria bacterium ADurb.Bin438]|nr:MAG: Chemotaxis protein PomA [Alphaproteobacteria bacterium ADurb.Bin438]